mmetsp:Transcript_12894/g.22291  ORF Transcript_12894/g.22291 Transcript_12894/m.22291 type:complete len:103 (-) Transcript_12894:308-616(-)
MATPVQPNLDSAPVSQLAPANADADICNEGFKCALCCRPHASWPLTAALHCTCASSGSGCRRKTILIGLLSAQQRHPGCEFESVTKVVKFENVTLEHQRVRL